MEREGGSWKGMPDVWQEWRDSLRRGGGAALGQRTLTAFGDISMTKEAWETGHKAQYILRGSLTTAANTCCTFEPWFTLRHLHRHNQQSS